MKVQGFCPMGCGQTLFLDTGGHITCGWPPCPDPGALDTIASEPITEHIVHIRAKDFTIRHPLRDRIGHNLEECTVHQWLSSLDEPPREPGTYLVAPTSTGWAWIPQPTQGES